MLRKGQKELVELYRKGYCAIPAIPGGGKTYALTQWAVKIISEGLQGKGKVLIVTYMNSAAKNFKRRIGEELNKLGISSNKSYFVSTIHSLCMQIIKDKPDGVMVTDEFEIIEGYLQTNLIRDSVYEWKRRGNNKRIYEYFVDEYMVERYGWEKYGKKWEDDFVNVVRTAISDFKSEGVSPIEAVKMTKDLGAVSLLRISAEIYIEYEKRLRYRGMLDFDDMLYKAKYILENDKGILDKYRKKYTYVCEDEAQDSNKIQTEILSLIAGGEGNFLRVGDSNQAITGTFTNSDPKLFRDFCENPKVTVYNITKSSRNTKQIIDLANSFVRYVRECHPVQECRDSLVPQYIETVDADDEFPNPVIDGDGAFIGYFDKPEEEYESLVNEAVNLINKYPDKTTAILMPSAYHFTQIMKLLDNRKVKYESLDNNSVKRNETLVKLGLMLKFIGLPEKNENLVELLKEVFIDEECQGREELLNFLSDYPVEKLLYPMAGGIRIKDINQEIRESDAWKQFNEVMPLLKDLLEFPPAMPEKLILYISEKLDFNREEKAIAQKVSSSVRFLMIDNPRLKLTDIAEELLRNKNMFNYFANLVFELKGYEAKKGVITLSTYHKAKGLEWDNVFLGGITSGDFPVTLQDKFKGDCNYLKQEYRNPLIFLRSEMNKLKGNDIELSRLSKLETISERTRLLYVGITRAKERIYLSAVKNKFTRPSKYMEELEKILI